MAVLEAHGTGTALGDPIEAGAIASVYLQQSGSEIVPLAVGSLKANAGHTEPGAGLAGTLKLLVQLQDAQMSPNAQLRVLNKHVSSVLRGWPTCVMPVQLARLVEYATQHKRDSSLGVCS